MYGKVLERFGPQKNNTSLPLKDQNSCIEHIHVILVGKQKVSKIPFYFTWEKEPFTFKLSGSNTCIPGDVSLFVQNTDLCVSEERVHLNIVEKA